MTAYRTPDLTREQGIVAARSVKGIEQWLARADDEYLHKGFDYNHDGEVIEYTNLDTWAVAELVQAERIRAYDLGVAAGLLGETDNLFERADKES